MSRVINPNGVGKTRNRLVKAVVIALRELMSQTDADANTQDLAAFIALSLDEIADTIDPSVAAWEKRGYWVKADRFRMEWVWTRKLGKEMRAALIDEDWSIVAVTSAQVAQKLGTVKVSPRHRMGKPWVGAWKKMLAAQP